MTHATFPHYKLLNLCGLRCQLHLAQEHGRTPPLALVVELGQSAATPKRDANFRTGPKACAQPAERDDALKRKARRRPCRAPEGVRRNDGAQARTRWPLVVHDVEEPQSLERGRTVLDVLDKGQASVEESDDAQGELRHRTSLQQLFELSEQHLVIEHTRAKQHHPHIIARVRIAVAGVGRLRARGLEVAAELVVAARLFGALLERSAR